MSLHDEKRKPEKPQYRCCVCHGGPSEALGLMQYAGRRVMEALRTNNPMAHRLCIPTYLRTNPRGSAPAPPPSRRTRRPR